LFPRLFFAKPIFTASAAIPPVDSALPAINAALEIHAGHMESSFWRKPSWSIVVC
jgi:hypothetical protein